MKNYLIILLLFLIVGCSKDLDTLQKRGDTYYDINSEEPFSGLIINKYESGQKRTKGYLTNGKEDGIWTWWYENGQKEKEVDFLDGILDGLSTEWDENGLKWLETTYKDGKGISSKRWNEDGSVKE